MDRDTLVQLFHAPTVEAITIVIVKIFLQLGLIMRVLALDLGCNTGWCHNYPEKLELGTEVWSTKAEVVKWHRNRQDRRCDLRVLKFFRWVKLGQHRYDKVIFEDVQFIRNTYQGHLWASWRTAVWLAVSACKIECIPVGTLKKFATGNGGAGKGGMAEAMRRTDPKRFSLDKSHKKGHLIKDGDRTLTDDAVDAFWLFQWAQKHIKL